MRALITGATGFAGSHLADYLIDKQGLEVFGTMRPRSRTEFVRPDVFYIDADITDQSSMSNMITNLRPAYIFHLAAQSFVPLSWTAPRPTLETNLIGTLNILEVLRHHDDEVTLQIACSSEEYGIVEPDECPITELQPLRPQSPYGVSKVAADLLGQQYHRSYGLKVIITRAFNHTGPRRGAQFVESKIARHLVLLKLGKTKEPLKLGNLAAIRDYTDVRDTVRAYWLAANRCQPGIPYNIGTGIGASVSDVLGILSSISGIRPDIQQDKVFMRPSDVPRLIADSTALRFATGWKPEIPFEQTMRDLFDYWMEREK